MTDVEWESFEARLRTYVGSRVESRWVDDVVGDILLKLVRHRDAVEAARNPLAFVLRVASNAIADHYRRKSVERQVLTDLERESKDGAAAVAPPDDQAAAEMARCVAPFIENLPGKYREALQLTEIEGLAQTEAARRLGLSVSGMKSRVQRGRARVRESLLQCCTVELDRRGGIADYAPRSVGCAGDCGE
jgi:RNA polymerase sigma-70 factor (ECF subfamily)